MPYHPPIFYVLLSRYLSRYHVDTTPLLSTTFPIPIYLSSARHPNILHLQRSNLPTTGAQRRSTAKRTTNYPPATCQVLGVNSPSNILLLPRLIVEYSVLSLFISPESYSGISVIVLPLSVHAEYPCVPLGSQVLGDNPPSKYSSIVSTCCRVFCSFFVH